MLALYGDKHYLFYKLAIFLQSDVTDYLKKIDFERKFTNYFGTKFYRR